jgi:hypothetical protein
MVVSFAAWFFIVGFAHGLAHVLLQAMCTPPLRLPRGAVAVWVLLTLLWTLENGNMFSARSESWGQRKRPKGEDPGGLGASLVPVAERADRRSIPAWQGGGGAGTHDCKRRRQLVSADPLVALTRVRQKQPKASKQLSAGLPERPVAVRGKKQTNGERGRLLQRSSKHPSTCCTVTSVESLGACFWSGKGNQVPGMLVVECNGLVGVLKTAAPLRMWWTGDSTADGGATVCCGGTSMFETVAGCACNKKWHRSLKTRVGEDLVPVGQVPGVLEAARLSQQLASTACFASCGCREAPAGVRLSSC